MNNDESILREAEGIAAAHEAKTAMDVEKIHAALVDYSKKLELDGTISITRITRYMDDTVEVFSVYMQVEFLCGNCDDTHVGRTHAIVKRSGDRFVALDSELVLDRTEEMSQEVVVRVPSMRFGKKRRKKKNKKRGEEGKDERE